MAHDPTYSLISTTESSGNISTSRAVRDVDKGIAYVDPDSAPLTVITMRAKGQQRTASAKKVEWIEKEMDPPRWATVAGASTTGEGAITVDTGQGARFRAGDLVKVPSTGEVVLVVSISTDEVTVTRSIGDTDGTDAATIGDNAALLIIGNAAAEGADVRTARSHNEDYEHNYLQIIRTELSVTNSQAAFTNYTGPDLPRLRKEKAAEHRRDIERQFLFGERSGNMGSSNAPNWAMGGLLYYLTENAKTSVGTLTEPEVWDWAEDLFQHNGGAASRLWVASPLTCTAIDLLAAGRLQTVPKEDTFGLAVKTWVTSHGNFNIVKHPMLVNEPSIPAAAYGGYSFALDPKKLKYVTAKGRSTKLLENRQGNGEDKRTDEYLTEVSLQVENPVFHGTMTGVTG